MWQGVLYTDDNDGNADVEDNSSNNNNNVVQLH